MQVKRANTAEKKPISLPTSKVIALVLIVVLGIYLNRSYARIYETIEKAGLVSPLTSTEYSVIAAHSQNKQLAYVSLGDSLSAGVGVSDVTESLPYLLAQKIAGTGYAVALHSLARPGARTSDILQTQLSAAIAAQPDMVTLLIGTNDIHGNISAEQFSDNYSKILDQLMTQTHAKIYCVNIPALGANSLLLPPYQSYFDYRTRQYNDIIKRLAQQRGLVYIDIYTSTHTLFHSGGPQYAADLFHPSASGYQVLANIIYAGLNL